MAEEVATFNIIHKVEHMHVLFHCCNVYIRCYLIYTYSAVRLNLPTTYYLPPSPSLFNHVLSICPRFYPQRYGSVQTEWPTQHSSQQTPFKCTSDFISSIPKSKSSLQNTHNKRIHNTATVNTA